MSDLLLISSTVLESHNDMAFIITLPIESKSPAGNKIINAPVLLDCGAEGNFMNPQYAQKHNVHLYPLSHPIIPWNVDGSINQAGKIPFHPHQNQDWEGPIPHMTTSHEHWKAQHNPRPPLAMRVQPSN